MRNLFETDPDATTILEDDQGLGEVPSPDDETQE